MHGRGYPTRGAGVEPPEAALLSPGGRGALAVVGVVGVGAVRLLDGLFTPRGGRPLSGGGDSASSGAATEVRFGRWHGHAGGAVEDVVVVTWRWIDRVEVHCHGGCAAAEGVIGSLVAAGARRVPWQRWLASSGEPEWMVEAREALAVVRGPKAARILTRQFAGAWESAWRRLEAAPGSAPTAEMVTTVSRLLAASRIGLRLTRPWRVVLVGPVNAGKSSLVNALAGHARSIVTPVPGTTRDLVETRIVLDGWEVDLVDTAGLRGPDEPVGTVERAGIARAGAAATLADLVVCVVPADAVALPPPPPPPPDHLVVLSRCDLAARPFVGPWPAGSAVSTSAVTGLGIDALAAAIMARLVPEERDDPELLSGAVPFTSRQVEALHAVLRRDGAAAR